MEVIDLLKDGAVWSREELVFFTEKDDRAVVGMERSNKWCFINSRGLRCHNIRRMPIMCDTCGNCKWLKYLGKDRLYPYRCRKEKAGITHSEEWFSDNVHHLYKCDKWERKGGDE